MNQAFQMVCFFVVGLGVVIGLWTNLLMPDPYGQVGGGEMSLDVPDNVPSPPLDSAAGQAEVEQLREAIAVVRAGRADPRAIGPSEAPTWPDEPIEPLDPTEKEAA